MNTTPADRVAVSADGTPIALSTVGSGPALVVVGGAFDRRGGGSLDRIAAAFADRFTVTTYDRRSRNVGADRAVYSIERDVEDLDAVIGSAGGHAHVLALCVGAGVALHAMERGAPIDRAVLFEPTYRAGATAEDGAHHVEVLQQALDQGRPAKAVAHFLVSVLGHPAIAPLVVRFQPKLRRVLLRSADSLAADARAMGGFALPEGGFPSITKPVLVVAGGDSTDRLKMAAQATVEAIPGSAHTVLQDQDHEVDPEALLPVAAHFLLAR